LNAGTDERQADTACGNFAATEGTGRVRETELRDFWLNLLREEGFRPEVDDDGDIRFKYEGGIYYITVSDDERYFQVIFPAFWSIESAKERSRALRAAVRATRETKVAKVFLNSREDDVWATAELFADPPSAVQPVFARCLRAIDVAIEVFREEMKA
jgi:hypothetical protein